MLIQEAMESISGSGAFAANVEHQRHASRFESEVALQSGLGFDGLDDSFRSSRLG